MARLIVVASEDGRRMECKPLKTFLPYGTKMVLQPSGTWREAEPGEQHDATLAQDLVIEGRPHQRAFVTKAKLPPLGASWDKLPECIQKAMKELGQRLMARSVPGGEETKTWRDRSPLL